MALRLHQWHRALLQANPLLARYGRACGVGRPAHDEPGTQQEAGARSAGMTRSTACRGPAAKRAVTKPHRLRGWPSVPWSQTGIIYASLNGPGRPGLVLYAHSRKVG